MLSSQRRSPIECRRPLAKCIAAMFALAAPEAFANTWTVTSCADHGAGSLRDIVAAPTTLSLDTVDVSACSVSGISLTTGAIHVTQDSLFLRGPSDGFTTITGYYNGAIENDRIINHTGTGNLGLEYLRISYGSIFSSSSNIAGGCVSSQGEVILNHTQILDCTAHGTGSATAFGAGIYAKGNLIAKYSQIVGNYSFGRGFSGGAHVRGVFSASNTTVEGNHADSDAGGVYAGSASITSSTISGNSASGNAGGLKVGVFDSPSANYLLISDSTISGNVAVANTGGVYTSASTLTVRNSTIAFNFARVGRNSNTYYSPGLTVAGNGSGQAVTISLESSILSNNTYGTTSTTENDFSAIAVAGNAFTISASSNNIIRAELGPLHPATITTACPLLAPLHDNGGPTRTHALLSHSPAIDAGNNNSNLADDQRGTGFARASGAAPDIGAYEVQQADIVFNAGFDGCPILQ